MTPGVSLLAAAAAIEAAEGVVVLGLGCLVAAETAAGLASSGEAGAVLAAIGVLAGVGIVFVGSGLLRRRRWSRTPAVLTQILAIPVAISLVSSGRPYAGVPLVVAAAVGLVMLFGPGVTPALYSSGRVTPSRPAPQATSKARDARTVHGRRAPRRS